MPSGFVSLKVFDLYSANARDALMEKQTSFSEKVETRLGNYVYRLIDPRNGTTFYIGRGKGNRVFSHAAGQQGKTKSEDDEALKLKTIRAIRNAGFQVQHVIHRHGMSEDAAKEVEAALIDAYPGLTNIQGGYDNDRGVLHAAEIVRFFEAPEAEFQHKLILINVNKTSGEEELIDAVRYAWKIDPLRADKAEYVLAVRRGLIIGAFEVEGEWLPATRKNFPPFSSVGRKGPRKGRFGFWGHDAPKEVSKLYVQTRIPAEFRKRGAANPIRYVNI